MKLCILNNYHGIFLALLLLTLTWSAYFAASQNASGDEREGWLYFQFHTGTECSNSPIFHIEGIRNNKCLRDKRFYSLLRRTIFDDCSDEDHELSYVVTSFLQPVPNNSTVDVNMLPNNSTDGGIIAIEEPFIPVPMKMSSAQLQPLQERQQLPTAVTVSIYNNTDCSGVEHDSLSIPIYSTWDSEGVYLNQSKEDGWIVNGCKQQSDTLLMSLKYRVGSYEGVKLPDVYVGAILEESVYETTCFSSPVLHRETITDTCLPVSSSTSVVYTCNGGINPSLTYFNQTNSCSLEGSEHSMIDYCPVIATPSPPIFYGDPSDSGGVSVPMPMPMVRRLRSLSDHVRTNNELPSTAACIAVSPAQGKYPTKQPVTVPTASPTHRTTSLLDVTFSFTVNEVMREDIVNDDIVKNRFADMACMVLDLATESCKCQDGCLAIIPEPTILAPVVISSSTKFAKEKSDGHSKSLRLGHVGLRSDSTVTNSYVLSVNINITLNTIDFIGSNSDNVTKTMEIASRRLNAIPSSLTWGFFVQESLSDTPAWISMNSLFLTPSLHLESVVFPSQNRSQQSPLIPLPSAAPTITQVHSSASDPAVSFEEVIGIAVGIGGLLIFPALVYCLCRSYSTASNYGVTTTAPNDSENTGECQSCYHQSLSLAQAFVRVPSLPTSCSICSASCCNCCNINDTIVLPSANTTGEAATWNI